MKVSIIAAIGKNGELGKEGKLPWSIKEDLKYFKQKTEGHYVVMGRKTYESLPSKLVNRKIIVITTQTGYDAGDPDVVVLHSVGAVILYLTALDADHAYICGGGKVYEQFVGYADYLLLTRVNSVVEDADSFFPLLQLGNWHLMTSRPQVEFDSGYEYYFEVWKRT